MMDGPTTTNGPLDEKMLSKRSIFASFADLAAAQAARTALTDAGVDSARVDLADQADVQGAALSADTGLLGRMREAVLPDDGETAVQSAIRNSETILTLRPPPGEVEVVIAILAAAKPSHFDANLERWRNAG